MALKLNILTTVVIIGLGFCIVSVSGNLTEESARVNSVSNSTKTLNGTISPPQGNEATKVLNVTTTLAPSTTTSAPILKETNSTIVKVKSNETSVALNQIITTTSAPKVNVTTTTTLPLNETSSTTTTPIPKVEPVDPRAYLDTFVAPIEIQLNFPYYHAGYDPENRPIWVIEGGKWNVRNIVEQGQAAMDDFEKFALQGFYRAEQTINASSTDEIPVTDEVLIVDFEGLSLLQIAHLPTVKFLLHLAQEIRYFLLKHLHVALVVNTNAVAHTLINLVRPIFARAFEHVEIYGTHKEKWIPHVLRYCPKSQIPLWYGGSKDFKPLKVFG